MNMNKLKFRARSIDSGIGIHGIEVTSPSFLRRFAFKLSNSC